MRDKIKDEWTLLLYDALSSIDFKIDEMISSENKWVINKGVEIRNIIDRSYSVYKTELGKQSI